MKKKITPLLILTSFFSFSQNDVEKIKNYLKDKINESAYTSADISDIVITNNFTTADNDMNIYHVKQRVNGIEVFTSDSNFIMKNGEVIGGNGKNFEKSLSRKVNSSSPNLGVLEGFRKALINLNESGFSNVQIIEKKENNKYKLAENTNDSRAINAQLVYYKINNSLSLAWNFEFFSKNRQHLWFLMVDTNSGDLLLKQDHILSCNFIDNDTNHENNSLDHHQITNNEFISNFIKADKSLAFTPGTTNYKVIPYNYFSPDHYTTDFPASTDGRTTVTNPEVTTFPVASPASPNGWHNSSSAIGASTTTHTNTQGNNVLAYSDFNNDDPTTPTTFANASSGSYPSLTFDHPYGGVSVAATTYTNAAITNLFYVNNMMHDIWYQYGFNEANKNFQTSNYGRGGSGNDPVYAEAQDSSTGNNTPQGTQTAGVPLFNNAFFGTPSDGSSPQMQMYLWNKPKIIPLRVTSGILSGKTYSYTDNSFTSGHVDLPASPSALTGALQLVSDGSPDVTDACAGTGVGATLPANSMTGRIAILRRGTCNFVLKVKAVQDAGAIGAIIVNNDTANPDATMYMSGGDSSITIPAIMLSYNDGEELIASIANSVPTQVQITVSRQANFVNSDGDFDNGIISHEYGHGISTRLSGNCLYGSAEQMGEGWSDWFGLMMQIKPSDIAGTNPTFADGAGKGARGVGTFAIGQLTDGGGIRAYKYSTNMTENPQTYGSTNAMTGPHPIGSVWATIIWDLAWNYMQKYGYNPDIINSNGLNKGNNRVMRLVLDGIKIDGCNPTFVSARDALIQADINTTGGKDVCMIFDTFARRGVGEGASAGAINDTTDQVESFTPLTVGSTPATGSACTTLSTTDFDDKNSIAIYPNPNNGQFNISINQFDGNADLDIIDINGRVVYSEKNIDFSVEKSINLSKVGAGLYIVKISSKNNTSLIKKLIIN